MEIILQMKINLVHATETLHQQPSPAPAGGDF
jgi:hypothetical protein